MPQYLAGGDRVRNGTRRAVARSPTSRRSCCFVLTADRLVATNGRAAQVVTRYEEEGSDAEAVEEYAFSSFPAVVMRVVGLVQIHKALQPTRAAQNAPLFGVAVGSGLFAEHDVTGRGPVAH